MDDPPADLARSGRDYFHGADTLGMLGELAAHPRVQKREPPVPYVRFALCFIGFFAVDAAVFFYVVPAWNEATEMNIAKKAATALQSSHVQVGNLQHEKPQSSIPRQTSTEIVHDSTTLVDGLKCSGGLVYRTAERDGIKEITVLMDGPNAVRCR